MVTKRALVLSGGGSWGAYGGGTLSRLDKNYNIIIGLSTGSLLAPLAALREWELLKYAFTNVDNSDIFDNIWYKGRPISSKGKIRNIPIIMTLLLGQKTICTSYALRKTIDVFFLEKYYQELKNQGKEILVGTQNFTEIPSRIHYFSSNNETYEEFKDWMWCSANFPFFTSLVRKSWNDCHGNFHVGFWCDGGLTDLIGINQLDNKRFNEIDIVLHRTKPHESYEGNKINNLIGNITTGINIMKCGIEFEYFYDKIRNLNKQGTKVTIYWLPRKLSDNVMVFNPEKMSMWWKEGYETAHDPERIEVFEPTNKQF